MSIGVDIGGTKILAGVVTEDGEVMWSGPVTHETVKVIFWPRLLAAV